MSETCTNGGSRDTIGRESAGAVPFGPAGWLSLAAAPTFASMALLTSVFGGGSSNMLCPAAQGMSPLCGMAAMYLLMAAFHSGPWLKLVSRRCGVRRS